MTTSLKTKALIAIPLSVLLIATAFLAFGYLIASILRLPSDLGLPIVVRVLGVSILLLGLGIMGSVFRLRRPADVLVSTYVTFLKVWRHTPLAEPTERTETLTVVGPYRYSRHPLYLGVVMLWVGLWLITDYTFLIITSLLFFLWFNFVITPLEEKELIALFGDQYTGYMNKIPRLIPFTRLGK